MNINNPIEVAVRADNGFKDNGKIRGYPPIAFLEISNTDGDILFFDADVKEDSKSLC